MKRSSEFSAAERARWLAELSAALREACALVQELGAEEGRLEALDLYAQIEALRAEVETMRLRRPTSSARELGPEWTNSPWCGGTSSSSA